MSFLSQAAIEARIEKQQAEDIDDFIEKAENESHLDSVEQAYRDIEEFESRTKSFQRLQKQNANAFAFESKNVAGNLAA